ncbi:MAG: hypothetical protein F6K28_23160, partial [Microcoleus sp. SIO2G3]|nr:hypothetical protein [Microcoleus sp. SIO2G3]
VDAAEDATPETVRWPRRCVAVAVARDGSTVAAAFADRTQDAGWSYTTIHRADVALIDAAAGRVL